MRLLHVLSWSLTINFANAAERIYYIKVEPVVWDYAPRIHTDMNNQPIHVNNTIKDRILYVGYTDDSFTTPTAQQSTNGDLGPVIRASVNDTITIHMWNVSNRTVSLHPHGVKYDVDIDGMISGVEPGANATFKWQVPPRSGPQNGQPSKLWAYHSHINESDVYLGLIGAIVIYANSSIEAEILATTDETFMKSMIDVYPKPGSDTEMDGDDSNIEQFFALNGYIYGNLPDVEVSMNRPMIWYLLSFGDEDGMHSMHWHGNVVESKNKDTMDVVDLFPASFETVVMKADSPGRWMFHCHVVEHFENGMYTYYTVW